MMAKTDHCAIVEEVLSSVQVSAPPVDPFAIAQAEGIRLGPGTYAGDFEALIEYLPEMGFFVVYFQDGGNEHPRTRFTVAHELAHYFIPSHHQRLLAGDVHTSKAGFVSARESELEADRFAAGLLMPRAMFRSAMRDISIAEMRRLAALFETSFTSTAHRMVDETPMACSAVFSREHKVWYARHSDELRCQGIYGIRRGDPVPSGSKTALITGGGAGDKEERKTWAREWYKCPRTRDDDVEIWEEVVSLGEYGVLTLLVYDP